MDPTVVKGKSVSSHGKPPQPSAPPQREAQTLEAPVPHSWLIFADESKLGQELVDQLTAAGSTCRTVHSGKKYASKKENFTIRADEPADWKQLFATLAADALPDRILYLWTLDQKPGLKDEDALMGIDHLLHLTHALEETMPVAKLRIDLVTRGAQAAGRDMGPTSVAQAPSIGIFRVILSEHPNYACHGIDLPTEVGKRILLCSGTNSSTWTTSAKSPSAVRLVTCSAFLVACPLGSKNSMQQCHCVSSPVNAVSWTASDSHLSRSRHVHVARF
jgi:hypothetical protein